MQYVVSTQSTNLNVRSGPGRQYRVVGSLVRGARVEVIGHQDQKYGTPPTIERWMKLANGGWVHGNYLAAVSGVHTIRFNVPMVRQQFSPVCWLASAAMVMQYKGRYTPSTATLGLQGPDFRNPGLTVASEYPTGQQQQTALSRLGFTGTRSNQCSEEDIFRVLDQHGPFLLLHHVGMFWYGSQVTIPPQARGSGHVVAVTGLDVDRHAVYFHNPWGQRDVPTTVQSICGAIERWERNPSNCAIYWL